MRGGWLNEALLRPLVGITGILLCPRLSIKNPAFEPRFTFVVGRDLPCGERPFVSTILLLKTTA